MVGAQLRQCKGAGVSSIAAAVDCGDKCGARRGAACLLHALPARKLKEDVSCGEEALLWLEA
jgi:hypothetical protein